MHKEEVRRKKQNLKPLWQHPGRLSLGRSRPCFCMGTWTKMLKRNSRAGSWAKSLYVRNQGCNEESS